MKQTLVRPIIKIAVVLFFLAAGASGKLFSQQGGHLNVKLSGLKSLGKVDERFQSFNVEMAEVVGGNFWIPYDKIDSTKPITGNVVVGETKNLYRPVPPIDLYGKRLRM